MCAVRKGGLAMSEGVEEDRERRLAGYWLVFLVT